MFEKLYTDPSIIFRHESAPYKEERECYLTHCERQGYSPSTLLWLARELLWVARKLPPSLEQGMTFRQVEAIACGWKERERSWGQTLTLRHTRYRFIRVARSWLRFLGYWRSTERSIPFANLAENYRAWMKDERGFTSLTIDRRCGHLAQFLHWYGNRSSQISVVCLNDIDAFLAYYGAKGNCRESVKNMAAALRAFFKYAGAQGWCPTLIAHGIHGPRIFTQEQLPSGPSWQDVRRLISSMETDRAVDIRDRAMVMLLAIYGFRAREVLALRLEDFDWEQNLISVSRVKRRGRQTYPLIPAVGNAIIRYLEEVRPPSSYREIFLTLVPPFRPLAGGTLYPVTSKRMASLGIRVRHLGPHSLRHACAAHLVAEGFSLKEIGDHLGHRCSLATRIYAKVDMPSLREVATFDIGGLI